MPGMLVTAQAARYAQRWSHCGGITQLMARFFAPVLVDVALQVEAKVGALDDSTRRTILRINVSQRGAIAEAEVAPAN